VRRTLYDDIGGEPAVTEVVDRLYRRVVADPDLRGFFDGRDLARIEAHQRALLTVALGGTPDGYTGRTMHTAHAGLAITHNAFDRVLAHLSGALADVGVPDITSARIVAMLRPIRGDVVQAVPAVAIGV